MIIKEILKCIISYPLYFWRSYISNEIHVEDVDKTIEVLVNSDFSIARFGDGEIAIIRGKDIRFQNADNELRNELIETIKNNEDEYIVAIPDVYTFCALRQYKRKDKRLWMKESIFSYPIYLKYCKNKTCYSSLVSRLYLPFDCDEAVIKKRFFRIKQIWNKKNILIVEGRYSRLGVGNDLFNNTLGIHRILCPEKNAYSVIDDIVNEVDFQFLQHNYDLVIAALGPAAKVVVHRLYKKVRVLDLGHIDIEYEWYLKRSKEKTPIIGKAVNEAKEGYNDLNLYNEEYEKQIIKEIGIRND